MRFVPTLLAAACGLALSACGGSSSSSTPAATEQLTGFSECRQFFPGELPRLTALRERMPRDLCYDAFAILHSGRSKTPVFVVERLSREQLLDADDEVRTNRFFADARLPSAERALLEDYAGSGYDRGHMAPAGDMPTAQAMAQSFSLANMVPQAPANNRGSWAGIERATRDYAMRASGPVYVFTGPFHDTRTPKTIGPGRVWVPTHLFKLVYDPQSNRAWAHWIENTDEARAGTPIGYGELVQRTGIEFLPGLRPRD
ncbi:DNA/RNA non-specific endonuclease [Caldimonas tepidiphila]|uniref:DNA/RNA non-specific endonuclease n=1 Tax=Caldimonas tepidiphila TaxID=2315841 RepID=UPI000E5ABF39|nr:DNA/RNA non-specific endonuclease [Caldimonas tepidiphila]